MNIKTIDTHYCKDNVSKTEPDARKIEWRHMQDGKEVDIETWWEVGQEGESITVRFCPFCGEKLNGRNPL